jgi:hypothetical protein
MECTTKKCKNIVDKIKELKKQEFNPLFKWQKFSLMSV